MTKEIALRIYTRRQATAENCFAFIYHSNRANYRAKPLLWNRCQRRDTCEPVNSIAVKVPTYSRCSVCKSGGLFVSVSRSDRKRLETQTLTLHAIMPDFAAVSLARSTPFTGIKRCSFTFININFASYWWKSDPRFSGKPRTRWCMHRRCPCIVIKKQGRP